MKIAILVNEATMKRCTGNGCFNAFFNRLDAFSKYDQDAQILGFTHVGGDLDYKIQKLKKNGVDTVHLSTCLRGKYEDYEELAQKLALYFDVIGYTHGSQNGKTRDAINIKRYENK